MDHIRCLDPQVIPYNEDNEDQNVQPGDVLNHGYKDELSLDCSMYDGNSTECFPNCDNVVSPMKDMYAVRLICIPRTSNVQLRRSMGTWNGYFYHHDGGPSRVDSMQKFFLVPGEGEHDFKADVWSIKGRQTIAGSWSKGEDDVIHVKFKYKIVFSSTLWFPRFFNGLFDPDRVALTGVWSFSAEPGTSMGVAEFRRIPPRYLTVYPSIKELRDNKPRALWRFAIAVVRNDIRRDHWTWSYFSQRRDDRKAVVSLLVRSRWFGPPLSAEETETRNAIIRRLMPDDASFYDSKVDHIRVYTCIHE
jgi:hypothetical protein